MNHNQQQYANSLQQLNNALTSELKHCHIRIESLSNQLDAARAAYRQQENRLIELNAQQQNLVDEASHYKCLNTKLSGDCIALQRRMEDALQQLATFRSTYQSALTELEQALNRTRSDYNSLEDANNRLKTENNQLQQNHRRQKSMVSQLISQNRILTAEVTASRQRIEQFYKETSQLRQQVQSQQQEIFSLNSKVMIAGNNTHRTTDIQREDVDDIRRKNRQLQDQLKNKTDVLEQLRDQVTVLGKEISSIRVQMTVDSRPRLRELTTPNASNNSSGNNTRRGHQPSSSVESEVVYNSERDKLLDYITELEAMVQNNKQESKQQQQQWQYENNRNYYFSDAKPNNMGEISRSRRNNSTSEELERLRQQYTSLLKQNNSLIEANAKTERKKNEYFFELQKCKKQNVGGDSKLFGGRSRASEKNDVNISAYLRTSQNRSFYKDESKNDDAMSPQYDNTRGESRDQPQNFARSLSNVQYRKLSLSKSQTEHLLENVPSENFSNENYSKDIKFMHQENSHVFSRVACKQNILLKNQRSRLDQNNNMASEITSRIEMASNGSPELSFQRLSGSLGDGSRVRIGWRMLHESEENNDIKGSCYAERKGFEERVDTEGMDSPNEENQRPLRNHWNQLQNKLNTILSKRELGGKAAYDTINNSAACDGEQQQYMRKEKSFTSLKLRI